METVVSCNGISFYAIIFLPVLPIFVTFIVDRFCSIRSFRDLVCAAVLATTSEKDDTEHSRVRNSSRYVLSPFQSCCSQISISSHVLFVARHYDEPFAAIS